MDSTRHGCALTSAGASTAGAARERWLTNEAVVAGAYDLHFVVVQPAACRHGMVGPHTGRVFVIGARPCAGRTRSSGRAGHGASVPLQMPGTVLPLGLRGVTDGKPVYLTRVPFISRCCEFSLLLKSQAEGSDPPDIR